MKKVKWGILGTAQIARNKVIPALKASEFCQVEGIASRNINMARETASEFEVPNCYGSYEEMLADSKIEAVYIPLPNHLHVPWCEKALAAGKQVLCEKPISINAQEAQKLWDFSKKHPHLRLMEAFMYRFHPQWVKAAEMVKAGKIGEVKTIQSVFSYFLMDPENCRNRLDMAGGGLMDIGCYPVNLSRMIFGREPEKVMGIMDMDPNFKIDRHTSAILDFGSGTSNFSCSTQMSNYQKVAIIGSEGRIEIQIPFNQPEDKPARILFFNGKKEKYISFPAANQYSIQADVFSKSILENTPLPITFEDAVLNMKTIDAVFKSAKSGNWERP